MTPVLIVPVQIPYHLFVQFQPLVDQLPMAVMKEWTEWRQELYRDTKSKLPLVQYYVGDMVVPDVYGFFYTSWIALQGLHDSK